MAYNTPVYLFAFLPLSLLIYQLTPRKWRWVALLLANYAFFWSISGKLLIYLIGTTLFTFGIGCWITRLKVQCKQVAAEAEKSARSEIKKNYKKKEKWVLTAGIVVLVGILGYLKYYNFFVENVNHIMEVNGSGAVLPTRKLLLPIGISFYTLEAIGYMTDVYWEKIKEQHLGKLALFLGFFPQTMEGPIGLYAQTAEDLWSGSPLQMENLTQGALRIFWGLFKKIVTADRLYRLVGAIFDHYTEYHGVMIAVAAISYTIQLYMEFSGTMDIIIGSGKMFGVTLPENFRQPFFSKNAAEFWRRWHMTLGVWFKTYIFYPVSVSGLTKKWNKFGKKHCGKYITKLGVSALALFPVWMCNGLWHGARWSYIFYGIYYFVILMAAQVIEPVRNKIIEWLHINVESVPFKLCEILKTWVIIFTGELFFRANGLRDGVYMFLSMFRGFTFAPLMDDTLLNLGLDSADYLVVIVGVIVVAVVGFIKEKKLLGEAGIHELKLPVRWALYYAVILAVIILGAYGNGYKQVDLIYAGF